MSDVYYSPEEFGLEIIGEIDTDEPYQFDMLVVWKHKEIGALYYAGDSGCSCRSPFEEFCKIDTLTPLTKESFFQFAKDVSNKPASPTDKVDLMAKVSTLLSLPPVVKHD